MRLPTIRLVEQQTVFETHLIRFVQEKFPMLSLNIRKAGEARRYELSSQEDLIVAVETLPISNELEVQIARPRSDDVGFCEGFYSWASHTYRDKMQFTSDVDRLTWPLPLIFAQQMFETWTEAEITHPSDEALKRKVIDIARETLPPVTRLSQDPLEDARCEMRRFKALVERQLSKDILAASEGGPRERFARAVLQAFLPERGYREVEVRGGYSDLLVFTKQGRFLYEAKIWRGPVYYRKGLQKLGDYIVGEDDNQELLGAFYVVFDPTRTKRAWRYLGNAFSIEVVEGREVDVIAIDLSPTIT